MARSALRADQLGLREAAEYFGVSVDTLRRRIKDELLPEAELVAGQFGNTWVLPMGELDTIGAREGWTAQGPSASLLQQVPTPPPPPPSWTGPEASAQEAPEPPLDSTVVDLRTGAVRLPMGGSGEGLTAEVLAELVSVREAITEAEVRAATAEASIGHLENDLERQTAAVRRAEADLEYWKAQHDHLAEDVTAERERRVTVEQAASVAEARVEELRHQNSEHAAVIHRVTQERDAHARALRDAEAAMGWWSRRRFAKKN